MSSHIVYIIQYNIVYILLSLCKEDWRMENIIEDLDNFMEREVYILLNSEQRTILEEKYEDFKRSNEMKIEELDYNQFVQDEERKIELLCIESSIHEQSSIESSILLCSWARGSIKKYKEKVKNVFKLLKKSIASNHILDNEEFEMTYNYKNIPQVNKLIDVLLNKEKNHNFQCLRSSFNIGKLFSELKAVKKNVKNIIETYNLNISRQFIQEKINLFLLMTDFPRLQQCNVSVNFLKSNKKIFIDEVRFREDLNFWRIL